MQRFVLGVALVIVVAVVALKATGNRVPLLDYPLGPVGGPGGGPVIGPQIEIHPPGYNINVP